MNIEHLGLIAAIIWFVKQGYDTHVEHKALDAYLKRSGWAGGHVRANRDGAK